MLKPLADVHVPMQLINGMLRREPDLDIVLAQNVDLRRLSDPQLLEWAAKEGRVLITLDVNTVPGFAYQRIREDQSMPGVIAVSSSMSLGQAIEDLLLLAMTSLPDEWEGASSIPAAVKCTSLNYTRPHIVPTNFLKMRLTPSFTSCIIRYCALLRAT